MNEIKTPPFWIKEKGKDILFIPYRFLSHQQIVEQFKLAIKMGKTKEGTLLVLSDFQNVPVTKAIVDDLKVLGAQALKEQEVKSAILGVTGIKRLLITIYSQFSKSNLAAFSTYPEAIDYLVEDE